MSAHARVAPAIVAARRLTDRFAPDMRGSIDQSIENQTIVCGLHRGITEGMLAELDPKAKLARFEPDDPDRAGCLVEVVTGS